MEKYDVVWSTDEDVSLADIVAKVPADIDMKDVQVLLSGHDPYDDCCYHSGRYNEIELCVKKTVPNPKYTYLKRKYDEHMASFPARLAEYERKCKAWEVLKVEQQAIREAKKKLAREEQKILKAFREEQWKKIDPDAGHGACDGFGGSDFFGMDDY